ncbi:MAG TPA: hypothetical protein VKX28_08025 [Xanthobacteraceae bacterium]|jgi:hypothetical protein|nr:hypothetical protein [Xanthobacteraceae bacterium]
MRKLLVLSSLSAMALLIAEAAPVRADDIAGASDFAKRVFAVKSIDKKTYACFVRRYDAAHLAQHPLQKVSAMRLLLTVEKVPEDAALEYSFRVGVNFRHRPGNFDSSGDCGHALASETKDGELEIHCNVDCDGGGVQVGLSKASDKSVVLRLEQIRIWDANKPDEDATHSLQGGADDRIFRLDRADVNECASLVADRKELAAMRRK